MSEKYYCLQLKHRNPSDYLLPAWRQRNSCPELVARFGGLADSGVCLLGLCRGWGRLYVLCTYKESFNILYNRYLSVLYIYHLEVPSGTRDFLYILFYSTSTPPFPPPTPQQVIVLLLSECSRFSFFSFFRVNDIHISCERITKLAATSLPIKLAKTVFNLAELPYPSSLQLTLQTWNEDPPIHVEAEDTYY